MSRAKTIACHKSIYNNHDKFVVLCYLLPSYDRRRVFRGDVQFQKLDNAPDGLTLAAPQPPLERIFHIPGQKARVPATLRTLAKHRQN